MYSELFNKMGHYFLDIQYYCYIIIWANKKLPKQRVDLMRILNLDVQIESGSNKFSKNRIKIQQCFKRWLRLRPN